MKRCHSPFLSALVVAGLFISTIYLGGVSGCGGGGDSSSTSSAGGGTSSGDLSIEALVSTPTVSSLTLAGLELKDSSLPVSSKLITETAQSGQEVHCEDLSGNKIGTACTTDSTGKCKVTGLTEAQVTAGVVVVSGDGIKTPIVHAYEEPETAAITAAKSGTAISTTINTESDVAFSVIKQTASDAAGGDLSKSKDKFDPRCLRDAMKAMIGDDSASTSDLGGYMEGMFQAHASSMAKVPVSGTTPADLMKDALAGKPEGMVGVVGKEVSKVPVADAATNFGKVIAQIKEAYCKKADASSKPPWVEIKEKAEKNSAGSFDPKAMCSLFKGFKPTEIGDYKPEYFKGFAQALPDLSGGFAMFGGHEQARRTAVSYFKQGAFNDPTKAGAAMGMMAATFPPPPTAGAYAKMDFTGFDWDVGARAAYNGFLELTGSDSKGTYNNPNTIFDKFNSTYGDATKRQAFAVGGSAACKDFIGGFVSKGGDFKPTDYAGTLKSPPGGSCTTSADCLPCDSCSSKVCTSLSTKMGAECTTNSDCGSDGTLACVGGSYTGAKRNCMCASAMPTGMAVHSTAGQTPMYAGVAGATGYAAPAAGAGGAQCGTGKTACTSGYTCSDTVTGVCLPAGFKKAPYTACSAATECESGTCTGNLCTALTATQITATGTATGGAIGTKTIGQSCASGSDCSTFYCSAGLCGSPPTVFAGATGTGSLKSNGSTCTTPGECVSYYCATTCQAPPTSGGTAPTGLPAGSYCSMSTECSSKNCDYANHKCL